MQEVFEKIIEKIKNLTHDNPMVTDNYILRCQAIEMVRQVATKYNNGWIPVNEDNLPKNREDVLILWGGGNRSTAYYVPGGAGGWFFNYGFDYKGNTKVPYEPYAWQPLPESYQPKGE